MTPGFCDITLVVVGSVLAVWYGHLVFPVSNLKCVIFSQEKVIVLEMLFEDHSNCS